MSALSRDEKQASGDASQAPNKNVEIDLNEKGLESFNKWLKNIFDSQVQSSKFGFLQLTSLKDLLIKCQSNGIIDKDTDLDDIEEDEDEFDGLINNLTLKTFIDNMEYLFISEKVGKALQDIDDICGKIEGRNENGFSHESTHTGNLKAQAFEDIVTKIEKLMAKKDYQKAFGYTLGLTYSCIDDTNGNAYWMNDNECTEEIDDNVLKPIFAIWSKILNDKQLKMSTLGCQIEDDAKIRKTLCQYIKRVQDDVNNTFEWYDKLDIKLPQ